MILMALDPSMTCTGYAIVTHEKGREMLIEAGTITPDGEDLVERCESLRSQIRSLMFSRYTTHSVIETPTVGARPNGSYKGRSAQSMPVYGVAVGVAIVAANVPTLVRGIPADQWTRGMPATRGDPHKQGRVRVAAARWNVTPESLGCKTKAGNVADAMLLAAWALGRPELWSKGGGR